MTANWWRLRRNIKIAKRILRDTQHFVDMWEDVLPTHIIHDISQARQRLQSSIKSRDMDSCRKYSCSLSSLLANSYPTKTLPRLRENIEVLVVAIAVAMAFRTYFIQPFKIPTGSMQPTLYGITITPVRGPNWTDRFPISLIKLAVLGERYIEVKAKATGTIQMLYKIEPSNDSYDVFIKGIPHSIHRTMMRHFIFGQRVKRGQVLATGIKHYGDHIFVDKVRYNFLPPKRGQIIVFSTDDITYPAVRTNNFYIKRLVGMPGEEISLSPPYALANGKKILQPDVFRTLAQSKNRGYHGYQYARPVPGMPPPLLTGENDSIHLNYHEYLPLGDNTLHSLDGRYFGPIKENSIVAPAIFVYWPFSRRWGTINMHRTLP